MYYFISLQIKDSSESERQWACHSLVHLTKERVNRDKLVRCGVVKKVTPLLMDQSLPVREAAAGLLRYEVLFKFGSLALKKYFIVNDVCMTFELS